MTALTGRPGALGEATTEPVLGVSTLVVVREISEDIALKTLSGLIIKAYWAPLTVLHLS